MQQADQTVPACLADISLSFVTSAQDSAQTLAVMLRALTKLLQPGSAVHDLAAHSLVIASTLAAESSDAADSLH